MPPLTFGFRALESYRAAVVKVGHLTIPFPINCGNNRSCDQIDRATGSLKRV